ncbi:putative Polysaccharide deacetylase [Candidatus Sulfopaludibacter sp. SbA4]|nr:putative Polysaccharide deacetylase [Candidatus Sulfopaludibacter sp. SbA4]
MIRGWIKTGTAEALSRTGMDRIVGSVFGPAGGSRRVPVVIGYHRVVEDFADSAATSIPSMLVSRQMLERHLDWIGRRFRFVSLDELGTRLDGNDGASDPIAAITFDDGYRDFYDHAFPLLRQKGIPAAVFVVSDLVSTTGVQIHDKLYLLLARRFAARPWEPGELAGSLRRFGIVIGDIVAATPFQATRELLEALPQESLRRVVDALETETSISEDTLKPFYSLTWEMLDRVRRAGMTIGSHTKTHVMMTNESGQRVADEVTGSREEIEKRLGTGVRHFAYPSGQFNTASVSAVANAGYRFGYTVCSHRDNGHPHLTIPRTLLWEKSCLDFRGAFSAPILSCQVHRAFDVVSGCRQRHRVSREGGNAQR